MFLLFSNICLGQMRHTITAAEFMEKTNPSTVHSLPSITEQVAPSKKDPFLFGLPDKSHGLLSKVKMTIKVGINTSEIQNADSTYLATSNFSDALGAIDVADLVKYSYRLKIYINKKTKVVFNMQAVGLGSLYNSNNSYTVGIIVKV